MMRSPLTIFPENIFKTLWDLTGFLFIVIQSIVVPFMLVFDVDPTGGFAVFSNLMDVFFMTDIRML